MTVSYIHIIENVYENGENTGMVEHKTGFKRPTQVDSAHGLITTVAYQLGPNSSPMYALEGSVAVAGAALGWLKDNIAILPDVAETQTLAETVPDTGDVYFVPAFSGLYAPYWNQEARGVICGINDETKPGHIIRAALEAVCFQVRDILDAMNQDCGVPLVELQVDGGMTANVLLMQLQSDLIGLNVLRPSILETTALGAAMAAGHGVGRWNLEERVKIPRQVFRPKINAGQRDVRYSKWQMAVERSLGWDV